MAWIKERDESDSFKLRRIYKKAESRTGKKTANVLKVHSIKPDVLEAHMRLYEVLMFGKGKLTRQQREMIGVVVSTSNSCPYCVNHHSEALFLVSFNIEKMALIAKDYNQAELNSLDLEICYYAEKLTKTPYKITEDNIIKLRDLGLDDEGIFEVNQIVSYFNYVNRVCNGLGVVMEEDIFPKK